MISISSNLSISSYHLDFLFPCFIALLERRNKLFLNSTSKSKKLTTKGRDEMQQPKNGISAYHTFGNWKRGMRLLTIKLKPLIQRQKTMTIGIELNSTELYNHQNCHTSLTLYFHSRAFITCIL